MRLNRKFPAGIVLATLLLAGCSNAPGFRSDRVTIGGPNYGVDQPPPEPVRMVAPRRPNGIVHFATNSAELNQEAVQTLAPIIRHLRERPHESLLIEGHTDARGSRAYNTALGMRRAHAVQRHLLSNGVAAHQLRAATIGRDRPLAGCNEDWCWQQNRRVHLFYEPEAAGRT